MQHGINLSFLTLWIVVVLIKREEPAFGKGRGGFSFRLVKFEILWNIWVEMIMKQLVK